MSDAAYDFNKTKEQKLDEILRNYLSDATHYVSGCVSDTDGFKKALLAWSQELDPEMEERIGLALCEEINGAHTIRSVKKAVLEAIRGKKVCDSCGQTIKE